MRRNWIHTHKKHLEQGQVYSKRYNIYTGLSKNPALMDSFLGSSQKPYESLALFQSGKLRLKKGERLAQGHMMNLKM